jgi:hypothetical protein
MAINGEWVLHYSWGCTGSFVQISITFNNDGTFTTSEGSPGRWSQQEGKIVWLFNNSSTVYGGDVVSVTMNGISSTLHGLNGCWYAIRSGVTSLAPTVQRPERDAAGNETSRP